MRRETSNAIRFFFEDLIPPALRDSRAFRWVAQLAWGRHILLLARFRQRAALLSAEEYAQLYRTHPRVHDTTDNSRACVRRILADAVGSRLLDVGCGTGHLLRTVAQARPGQFGRIVGVDFIAPAAAADAPIGYVAARIERLPFADRSFDTVICTHVIEHILDHRAAIAELRRVAARRLIIVVPREREGLYTFNPHFHFFPYTHSFLRAMIPLPPHHVCALVGRDIYYCEDLAEAGADGR